MNSEQLIAQLADDPENTTLLAVLGDLLESQGDPRGELIGMQLGIRRSTMAHAIEIAHRRKELLEQLTPAIPSALAGDQGTHDRFEWGTGFIRRVTLGIRPTPPPRESIAGALAELWAHPSLQILSELVTTNAHGVTLIAGTPPPPLRSLTISRGSDADADALGELLGNLPRLERMQVIGGTPLHGLAHPTLAAIELDVFSTWNQLDALVPADLPGVTRLHINLESDAQGSVECDAVIGSLAAAGWLDRLSGLALTQRLPTASSVRRLAEALGGRKLARLEVTGAPLPAPLAASLAALCDELVAVVAVAEPAYVEHANKPEWGRGRIVRRFDGKVEIDFPGAGTKIFKADLPFLVFS
jgi:hypothetical protein